LALLTIKITGKNKKLKKILIFTPLFGNFKPRGPKPVSNKKTS
jgi:hypothetical protein